jgi:hypothetical protein
MTSLISFDLQKSRTDAWLTGWLAELSDIGIPLVKEAPSWAMSSR